MEDLGSFATLTTAQACWSARCASRCCREREGARYYYNFALDIEALSVSDMDQLERWLRGVRGSTRGERGRARACGTLMLRMLGGEKRHYERRSPTFVAERPRIVNGN